jgi:AraC-like DNA-binding protein
MQATVAARFVRAIVTTWRLPRGETDRILARYGSTRADIEDPEARIAHDALVDILDLAVRTTGNEQLGLHSAMLWGARLVPVVDQIIGMSPSAGRALEKLSRYHKLIHDGFRVVVTRDGDGAIIELGFKEGLRCPPAIIEFCMATVSIVGRNMGRDALGPRAHANVEVFFTHPRPRDTGQYALIFGVPVHFGAKTNRMVLPDAMLDREWAQSSPDLSAILEGRADLLLKRARRSQQLAERVRRLISAELRGGRPTEARVALQLKTAPRTLRRRLAEEGTNFRDLLDAVRRDLALTCLRETGFHSEHTAFLLGFSDSRAFRRALKRWTGRGLRELRARERPSRSNPHRKIDGTTPT